MRLLYSRRSGSGCEKSLAFRRCCDGASSGLMLVRGKIGEIVQFDETMGLVRRSCNSSDSLLNATRENWQARPDEKKCNAGWDSGSLVRLGARTWGLEPCVSIAGGLPVILRQSLRFVCYVCCAVPCRIRVRVVYESGTRLAAGEGGR